MSNKYSKLFEGIKIGNLEIPNRYSMAPMGPVGFTTNEGAFNEAGINYYVERAKGGIGLIITGICTVENEIEPLQDPSIPCVTKSPLHFVQSGTILTERVHAYGSKIFLQLTAGLGRSAIPNFLRGKAVAPSEQENRWEPSIKHRELATQEVKTYIKKFAMSAAIAKKSGFDGVEIHAVHEGYLLDQFAISFYNKREDEFGGSLENRLRFATEIVKAIKGICGKDFPVSLRYSLKSMMKGLREGALPGEEFEEVGRDYEEGLEAAKILVNAGYDALNVDAGTYDSWYWNHPPMYFEDGMYRPFGKMVKEVVDVPVILAGRMDNPDIALSAIENGEADIIGLGRPVLADADIVNKVRTNKIDDIRPCLSCHEGCMGRISKAAGLSCAVNPACGREKTYDIGKSDISKKVLIVGGGLAGLEFARVCAIRGHKVEIHEKNDKFGGNIIPGGAPNFKKDDNNLVKWYEKTIKDLNVEIHMNSTLTQNDILSKNAEVVAIATGSKPIELKLNGFDSRVKTADKVLVDESLAGDKVVIVGAGLVGCETALWLAQKGRKVTIIEAANEILGGPHNLPFMNYDMLKDLLKFENVEIKTSTSIAGADSMGAIVKSSDGTEETIDADTIILSVGYKSNKDLYNSLKMEVENIYLLGDANNVKNIMYAIWNSYEVARNI